MESEQLEKESYQNVQISLWFIDVQHKNMPKKIFKKFFFIKFDKTYRNVHELDPDHDPFFPVYIQDTDLH